MSKIPVEPEVLHSVLRLLKHHSETMTETDETSFNGEWTYDKATDRIYEPKRHLMCIMIRGLTARWKQLLYYDTDANLTEDVLFKIIEKVEAAGFFSHCHGERPCTQ